LQLSSLDNYNMIQRKYGSYFL